jgi:hypothetical protein
MDRRDGVFVTGRYSGSEDFGLGLGTLPGMTGLGNVYVARLDRIDGEAGGARRPRPLRRRHGLRAHHAGDGGPGG